MAIELESLRARDEALEARVAALGDDMRRELATIHHRINKLEIRLLIYAVGGGAGGAILGAAGHAAAATLLGG